MAREKKSFCGCGGVSRELRAAAAREGGFEAEEEAKAEDEGREDRRWWATACSWLGSKTA